MHGRHFNDRYGVTLAKKNIVILISFVESNVMSMLGPKRSRSLRSVTLRNFVGFQIL